MKKVKEYIQIIKKLRANKKTRAWLGMGFYFIFIFILALIIRTSSNINYESDSSAGSPTEETQKTDIELILSNLQELSKENYEYRISIDNEEIVGSLKNGINSFLYNEDEYLIIYDEVYKKNSGNLELINNFIDDIGFYKEFLNIDNIVLYLDELDNSTYGALENTFEVTYKVKAYQILDFFDNNQVMFKLRGEDNKINEIEINYDDVNYVLVFN